MSARLTEVADMAGAPAGRGAPVVVGTGTEWLVLVRLDTACDMVACGSWSAPAVVPVAARGTTAVSVFVRIVGTVVERTLGVPGATRSVEGAVVAVAMWSMLPMPSCWASATPARPRSAIWSICMALVCVV